jgi:hypothetical protein
MFQVEINTIIRGKTGVIESGWRIAQEGVGNIHAARVFAEKATPKGSKARVKDLLGLIVWEN